MSDLYRMCEQCSGTRIIETGETVSRCVCVIGFVPAEPVLYVYQQGGLFEAFYRCDKDEADGALFDIADAVVVRVEDV